MAFDTFACPVAVLAGHGGGHPRPGHGDDRANTPATVLREMFAPDTIETLKTGCYDGMQLDNVSTEFPFRPELVGKWISALPVNLTPAQWTADEVAMLKAIMRAVADAGLKEKKTIFNRMRSGEPKGDYEAREGGFLRVFSRGCVAVNPTDKPLTLSLPQTYTTPAGQEIVRLPLPPRRGALLLARLESGGIPGKSN